MARTSSFDLTGKVALITGASRGIGFAIARHFLAQGAKVLICGIDATETAEALAKLETEFPPLQDGRQV